MARVSWCIVVYGVLLIACDFVDRAAALNLRVTESTMLPCWTGGMLIVAAGIASAQGRRSLRLTGLYLGTIFPLMLAGLFVWQAWRLWKVAEAPPGHSNAVMAALLLAMASVVVLACIAQFRPREGIASRGYAIPLPPARKVPPKDQKSHDQHRSEAG